MTNQATSLEQENSPRQTGETAAGKPRPEQGEMPFAMVQGKELWLFPKTSISRRMPSSISRSF